MYRRTIGLAALALSFAACTSSAATSAPTAAPASAAAMEVMGTGQLQPVDGTASGIAELVVLPDQTYEIILDGFAIDAIEHTNVVLTKNAPITSTNDVDKSMLLDLGPLVATEGMQSFVIPADMAGSVMEGYHSVVIWDTEMAHAIAAAQLQ